MLRDWDGEGNRDALQFEAILLFLGLFIISLFLSWEEVKYLTKGRDQDVRVIDVYKDTSGRGGRSTWVVQYAYDLDGRRRTAAAPLGVFDDRNKFHRNDLITIEYLGGEFPRSRIKGQHHWISLGVLASCAAAIAGLALKMYLASRKPRARGYVADL